MQPYFFPYPGYFQLMANADVFVFLDDVQYIDRGWVNRNRILVRDHPAWLSYPVEKAGRSVPINGRMYLGGGEADTIKNKLRAAYAKAAWFSEVFPEVGTMLGGDARNVAAVNARILQQLAGRLGIRCEFAFSSSILGGSQSLSGQDRILEICRRMGATRYINPVGGAFLYASSAFSRAGMELTFLVPQPLRYEQFGSHQIEGLSIIDVLMFNGFSGTAGLLSRTTPTPLASRGDGSIAFGISLPD